MTHEQLEQLEQLNQICLRTYEIKYLYIYIGNLLGLLGSLGLLNGFYT